MRHEWEEISLATPEDPFADMGHRGARRCKNCGVVQQRQAEYSWMRVVGYKWHPQVGRCTGNKKPD